MIKNNVFNQLFILEMANNHLGNIDRGKAIIRQYATLVREYKIKAAIKLQIRDVETFVHKNYKTLDQRYIKKTILSKLSFEQYQQLVNYIRQLNCIPMATAFDQVSVEWVQKLNLPIIKIASSDINDWILLNKIVQTKKPVIASTGGANQIEIENMVKFFQNRNIPLLLNHCVAKYPTEDKDLELNQILYLKQKFPQLPIGFSSHQYTNWWNSMLISYAMGVRSWQRHVDIVYNPKDKISKYCSLPYQVQEWFKAFYTVKQLCGNLYKQRRIIDDDERDYLQNLYRGLYFSIDMKKGQLITLKDLYSAIPYQKDKLQITSRQFIDHTYKLNCDVKRDEPLCFTQLQETL